MLSDEDREWLKALNEKLWPPDHKNGVVSLEASRQLSNNEYERVTRLLDEENLVLEFISTNMFGGYGLRIYDHEPFPGTGAQYLGTLIEGHLPAKRTRFERDVLKPGKKAPDHTPGSGSQRAWDYFSKYTHTDKMKALCKQYKLEAPRGQGHYDY